MGSGGWPTWLAFSCPHCPLQDPDAVGWLLERVKAIQPATIVCLGDLFEADSASRWPSEYKWTLEQEYESANAFLKSIREAAPDARRVFIEGNHDANINEPNRLPEEVRGLCDYRRESNCPELYHHWLKPTRYEFHRNRGVWRLGQVSFCHGFDRPDKRLATYLNNEYGLFVFGHTHRPTPPGPAVQVRMTEKMPLRFWYANAGCIRDLNPNYTKRKDTELWGQGLVWGTAEPVRNSRRKVRWTCTTEVFRMYDDELEPAGVAVTGVN